MDMLPLFVAGLALTVVLDLVVLRRQQRALNAERKRAEEAESWAAYWEDRCAEMAGSLEQVAGERDQYRTQMVRALLATNWPIVEHYRGIWR